MDSQILSHFFSLPMEIRQAVYTSVLPGAIHLFLRQDKVMACPCVLTEKESGHGFERRDWSNKDSQQDAVWLRRLDSSWGAHWQCEEIARGIAEAGRADQERGGDDHIYNSPAIPMLGVCKRLYMEILSTMTSGQVTFHVTDLETLLKLRHEPFNPLHLDMESCLGGPLPAALSSIRKLSLTLRLPLAVFEALHHNATREDSSISKEAQCLTLWKRVCRHLLSDAKKMTHFELWLDHDSTRPWYAVDERAFLSPLTAAACEIEKEDTHTAFSSLTIHLPYLHPLHENPRKHFCKAASPPPPIVTIKRRVRQRFFCGRGIDGRATPVHVEDFPLMYEIYAVDADTRGIDMDEEGLVEKERDMLEQGIDVERDIQLCYSLFTTCGLSIL